MSDEITPALTAEEWAVASLHQINVGVNSRGLLDFKGRSHAIAALCLHGQPFGFTQDDVRALDAAAEALQGYTTEDAVRSVRDRIAALLPPP